MNWDAHPKKTDIDHAYRSIAEYLTTSEHSLFIVIDLRYNVSLPISDIVKSSLNYHHPKFAAALIIGGHQTARTIANILKRITRQDKIFWFKDENEVYSYIKSQSACTGS